MQQRYLYQCTILLVSFSSIADYLPLGIEEHLGIASALELNGTDEDIEAEGRRRGVAALLEASFAAGEGVDVTAVTGCNSTSVPVTWSGPVPGVSII